LQAIAKLEIAVGLVDGKDMIASRRLSKSPGLRLKLRGKKFEERRGGEGVEPRTSSILEAAVSGDSAGGEDVGNSPGRWPVGSTTSRLSGNFARGS